MGGPPAFDRKAWYATELTRVRRDERGASGERRGSDDEVVRPNQSSSKGATDACVSNRGLPPKRQDSHVRHETLDFLHIAARVAAERGAVPQLSECHRGHRDVVG